MDSVKTRLLQLVMTMAPIYLSNMPDRGGAARVGGLALDMVQQMNPERLETMTEIKRDLVLHAYQIIERATGRVLTLPQWMAEALAA